MVYVRNKKSAYAVILMVKLAPDKVIIFSIDYIFSCCERNNSDDNPFVLQLECGLIKQIKADFPRIM